MSEQLTKTNYKQTEIGLIPEDWELVRFGDISKKIIGGGTPSRSNSEYWGSEIPWVTVKDFATFNPSSTQEYITLKGLKSSSSNLIKKGTLITSTRMALGKAVIYDVDVSINQDLKAIYTKNNITTDFLYCWFEFNSKNIEELGSGSTVMGLSLPELKKIQIPLPPLPEQKAIAQVLSDTDTLIQTITQKLIKKRAIKQGAMQQLLTPKDDWITKNLLELADSKKQFFDDGDWIESEHITSDGVRLIQTGNIGVGKYVEKENKKFIYESSFEKLKCKPLQEGDLLICRLAEPAGRACVLPKLPYDKIVTSVDVTIFRPRSEVANRVFLMNFFSTSKWFKQVYESVGGTTHKRISRGSLGKVSIKLPSIEEQTQIATILSDMDAEIAQLEEKLEKYKVLKQGLMQNLLTGKIRLV